MLFLARSSVVRELAESEGDEYCSAVAINVDEAKKLVEAGFECHNETTMFRKRK